MTAAEPVPKEEDVPAEVLRYLATLDASAGKALLARAQEMYLAMEPPRVPAPPVPNVQREPRRQPARFRLCDLGGRGCNDDACDCRESLQLEKLPAASRVRVEPVSEEEAKIAAEDFTRALAAGDFQAAGVIRHTADFSLLDETGWTCLHWLLHTAGSALASQVGGTEASVDNAGDDSLKADVEKLSRQQLEDCVGNAGDDSLMAEVGVGCDCCAETPAAPASRVLLRHVLSDLTDRGGVVDTRSSDNATPLMFAADARDREACEWLLAAGADPAARDDDGDTAAAWARAKGDEELAAWLQGCPKSR